MTDRDAIRREAFAEVIDYAETRASSAYALMENAREHGKDDMADRAEIYVDAWKAVAIRLRVHYLAQDL